MINKPLQLLIAIVIILAAIFYIESTKPKQSDVVSVERIAVQKVERTNTSASSTTATNSTDRTQILKEKSLKYSSAIELIPGGGFINTAPFTLKSLIGKKVILVDFWTYSCINCLRTLPYLKSWYSKYKDKGLVIVGVHTPEFDFEKDYNNVLKATKDLGVEYPVVQDNDYATWSAYHNQYWPHEYLIDIDGYIVDDHIGEGGYTDTEAAIQKALSERAAVLGLDKISQMPIGLPKDVISVDSSRVGSPEMYFGSARNEYLGNGVVGRAGTQTLVVPKNLETNKIYLGGEWSIQDQFAESKNSGGEIDLKYNSQNVYFVGSSKDGVSAAVYLDGTKVKTIFIKDNKLYDVVSGTDYGVHTIKMIVDKPGLSAFTFTFG
ncbi:MAG: redoxin domain-containing protein [Candidatus Vogelbacteria bacterium]|nr:redoxin domain-containing protein [Candidatus Vogelbacteria bacterium]